ncbi:MAG: VWA domain-containing protein [Candidatus Gracilibacteria bacterium]
MSLYLKQKNKYSILFLLISLFFLLINIFEIKGGYKKGAEDIEGGKIVFVLDVSKSMKVQDIQNDKNIFSRIRTSKDIIKKYIINNINNDYGLIIFAGEALEVLPFTNDVDIFNTILFGINESNISKFGTNINSIFSSLKNYFISEKDGGLVVIFSDLGDEEIDINKEQLENLKNKGVKILLVGVATEKGGKIPVGKDFFGRDIYKIYNYEEVVSKLNIIELKRISKKYNIDSIVLDNMNDFEIINNYITKNINLIDLERSINNRVDLTRIFILISFLSFILFLYTENFVGKRK